MPCHRDYFVLNLDTICIFLHNVDNKDISFGFHCEHSKIISVLQEAEESWRSETYSTENSSLLLLLRGVCLRYMGEMMMITRMTMFLLGWRIVALLMMMLI